MDRIIKKGEKVNPDEVNRKWWGNFSYGYRHDKGGGGDCLEKGGSRKINQSS